MTDLPKTAIDAAAEVIVREVPPLAHNWDACGEEDIAAEAQIIARAALEAAASSLAIAENLARLGVDPSEWDMYANALGYDMTPEQVLAAVRECITRDELDKLTEDG